MDGMNLILELIIWIGLSAVISLWLLIYWDKHSNLKFFCKILKWHKEPKWQDSNGFDHFGNCPRCGAKIYQNDDGSWETRKEEIEEDTD